MFGFDIQTVFRRFVGLSLCQFYIRCRFAESKYILAVMIPVLATFFFIRHFCPSFGTPLQIKCVVVSILSEVVREGH